MKQGMYRVAENKALTDSVWFMALEGDTSACTATGQFINLKLDGLYLRRPISVYDWTENQIQIIYKVVGKGTEQMSRLPVGATLDVLTGLGNGYHTEVSGDRPVLIGGGVGIPPLYALCKQLLKEGKHPSVILGFNTKQEVFCKDMFEALLEGTDGKVYVTLVDGGEEPGYYPGFVTNGANHGLLPPDGSPECQIAGRHWRACLSGCSGLLSSAIQCTLQTIRLPNLQRARKRSVFAGSGSGVSPANQCGFFKSAGTGFGWDPQLYVLLCQ